MATVDEILANMTEVNVAEAANEILVIDANTRQISVPGSELIFGVITDAAAERKYFLAPRYVGNNIDLSACFIRVSYRNANGEIDSHLIDDVVVTEDGQNIAFSWELHPKVTQYKGQVSFIVCAAQVGEKVNRWNTTLTTGIVLDGLEPTNVDIPDATSDVIAQLLAMVEKQTAAVEAEGAAQVKVVQTAAATAEAAAVAEIEAKGVNVRESIPDDYTALSEAVDGLVRGRAGAIVCEAEGSAVAVNDASDMKMQGLRIFGRSTQNGVPTPDAPVEIVSLEPTVGVYGKNLITGFVDSTKTANGVSFTVNADNSITVNGTATEAALFNMITAYEVTPVVRPGATYTISGATSVAAIQVYEWQDKWVQGASTSGEKTFTLSGNAKGLLVRYVVNPGMTADNLTVYPMLRLTSDVDNTYEPGKAAQTLKLTHTLPGIPVTSGGNYTDSDGQQWVCDEVDLSRGVYVQRISTETVVFSYGATYDRYEGMVAHYADAKYAEGSGIPVLSDILPYNKEASGGSNGIRISRSGTRMAIAYYNGEEITSATVSYPLATPIETPLSETEIAAYRALHTNKPNTAVLNDAGAHMVVKYAADTKLYIDNKIAALVGG